MNFPLCPGVEDIIDIVLNLKGLVLRSCSDDEETLYLEVEGVPGELREVTARDIQPSNVEIINLDHHLAEIDEEAKLSMKISVKRDGLS